MITVLVDKGHGDPPLTGGKESPDGRLKEYVWALEMAKMVVDSLKAKGVPAILLVPETKDIPISERVRRVNRFCSQLGSSNVLLVSIHNNAAKSDRKWHDARGFSVFVSKNASSRSKLCAAIFTEEARKANLLGNRSVPKEGYWTWSWTRYDIGILKYSKCPAVLTENLFQDNRQDVDFLLSHTGKKIICNLTVKAIQRYINEVLK